MRDLPIWLFTVNDLNILDIHKNAMETMDFSRMTESLLILQTCLHFIICLYVCINYVCIYIINIYIIDIYIHIIDT